jgi:hypothetical protein
MIYRYSESMRPAIAATDRTRVDNAKNKKDTTANGR